MSEEEEMEQPLRIRNEVDLMRAFEAWLRNEDTKMALSYEGPKDNLDETLAELAEPTCTVCGEEGSDVGVCGVCGLDDHLLCRHCNTWRNMCAARREDFE